MPMPNEIKQDLVAGSVWHRTAIAKSLAFLYYSLGMDLDLRAFLGRILSLSKDSFPPHRGYPRPR